MIKIEKFILKCLIRFWKENKLHFFIQVISLNNCWVIMFITFSKKDRNNL